MTEVIWSLLCVRMAKNKGSPSNLMIPLPPFWTKLVQISDLFGCRQASEIHDSWWLLISICHWCGRKVEQQILKCCVFQKSEHCGKGVDIKMISFLLKNTKTGNVSVFCFEPADMKAFDTFLTLWFLQFCPRKGFPKPSNFVYFSFFSKYLARSSS